MADDLRDSDEPARSQGRIVGRMAVVNLNWSWYSVSGKVETNGPPSFESPTQRPCTFARIFKIEKDRRKSLENSLDIRDREQGSLYC